MKINIKDQTQIIEHYGFTNQFGIHMEECAELIQAISKLNRNNYNMSKYFDVRNNVVEEIADVIVCIDQLQSILGISDNEIEEIVNRKISRQMERMVNEDEQ